MGALWDVVVRAGVHVDQTVGASEGAGRPKDRAEEFSVIHKFGACRPEEQQG